MDNIIKERILKNPSDRIKLQEEIKAKQAEIGVRDMIAIRGQDEFQQLDDLQNNVSKIQDQLAHADEKRRKEQKAKQAERRSRMNISEADYYRMKERKEREAYEKRKITLR